MIKTSCHYQLKHLSYGIGTIAGDRALNKCSTVTKLIDNRSKIGIYLWEHRVEQRDSLPIGYVGGAITVYTFNIKSK